MTFTIEYDGQRKIVSAKPTASVLDVLEIAFPAVAKFDMTKVVIVSSAKGLTMPRESVLYAEKYRRRAAMIKEHLLPNLPHIDGDKFAVHSGEIREAGRVKCADGVTREFQTITFLLTDRG